MPDKAGATKLFICPHTCGHTTAPQGTPAGAPQHLCGYVFLNRGNALRDHTRSVTMHSNCTPSCPGTDWKIAPKIEPSDELLLANMEALLRRFDTHPLIKMMLEDLKDQAQEASARSNRQDSQRSNPPEAGPSSQQPSRRAQPSCVPPSNRQDPQHSNQPEVGPSSQQLSTSRMSSRNPPPPAGTSHSHGAPSLPLIQPPESPVSNYQRPPQPDASPSFSLPTRRYPQRPNQPEVSTSLFRGVSNWFTILPLQQPQLDAQRLRQPEADLGYLSQIPSSPSNSLRAPSENLPLPAHLAPDLAPIFWRSQQVFGPPRVTWKIAALGIHRSPPAMRRIIPNTWVQPEDFDQTSFYFERFTFILVDIPWFRAKGDTPQQRDEWVAHTSWMNEVTDMSHDLFERFQQEWPLLALTTEAGDRYCWEWVSDSRVFHADLRCLLGWQLFVAAALLRRTGGDGCDLVLIKWEDYLRTLIRGEGRQWEKIKRADLILGGFYLDSDYMCVLLISLWIGLTFAIRNSDIAEPPPLDALLSILRNLKQLSSTTAIFPSPAQQLHRGHKLPVLQQLKEVAKSMGNAYPLVVRIADPYQERHFLARCQGLIVKRGMSLAGGHVLQLNTEAKEIIFKELIKKTNAQYDHEIIRAFGGVPEWFAVAYIPELHEMGELRAYFFGGRLSYIIWTRPTDDPELEMSVSRVKGITPLCYL